ncbi:uncharacterized protein LOC113355848 [Papaver somniferum]|uniref:uncharacterized protein LOC113355848 n=1 Tax=Papaver somniferum TaxID=3469 RepID=UPI000E6FE05C|nr:uncharacterized protein LOC113355848 [Papaver somniferum]
MFFPYGELDWSYELRLWEESIKDFGNSSLTLMDFYSYYIFPRVLEYSTILRGCKLFQELVVDAWASTEQIRLGWIRFSQDKLRADNYKSIIKLKEDGISPDQGGTPCVSPSTHVGGPRQMHEIYQDSMEITRYNHHPDIFLTMTANPNCTEIQEALYPHQTASDCPNLAERVFKMKRKALLDEIVEKKVFGDVVGPCGDRNKDSPCMKKGKCTKHYPKSYNDTTCLGGGGYQVYRRKNSGVEVAIRGGRKATNIDVVPYHPHLLRMFNFHINVEVCAGIREVKYINKYIYKGYDKTTFVVGSADEIQIYIDARYIGPPEAVWHLFGYRMYKEMHCVERLAIHLKGMQRIVYESEASTEGVTQTAENYKSKLMTYFEYYDENPNAPAYTYQEFPQHMVWKADKSIWEVRKKQSFEHLRTVNGVLHSTYKKASVELGLLESDGEFVNCLREASTVQVGIQMRNLFKIIMLDGNPAEPELLWKEFKMHICDDLHHVIKRKYDILEPTDEQIEDYGLYLIDKLLR